MWCEVLRAIGSGGGSGGGRGSGVEAGEGKNDVAVFTEGQVEGLCLGPCSDPNQ